MNTADIPVFILCGGLGTRIKEETEFRPKPMVPIGEHPILWHVMQVYAKHGFRRFVLCLGFKADVVKDYFHNFHLRNADCTIQLKTNEVTVHEHQHNPDWEITLAFTGEKNMTGSRVAQAARKYLGKAEHFAVTYGDGVTDADLTAELRQHLAGNKLGTVLGVNPPSRFGEIKVDGDRVLAFDDVNPQAIRVTDPSQSESEFRVRDPSQSESEIRVRDPSQRSESDPSQRSESDSGSGQPCASPAHRR